MDFLYNKRKGNRKRPRAEVERIVIPKYPIPEELASILDSNLMSRRTSRTSHNYVKIWKALQDVNCVDIAESEYLQLLKLALYLEAHEKNSKDSETAIQEENVDNPNKRYKNVSSEGGWGPNAPPPVFERLGPPLKRLQLHQTENVCHVQNENYPLRCAHYALGLMAQRGTITYLFPHENKFFIKTEISDCSDFEIEYKNPDIETNAEQKQAIRNIVNKSSSPAPYILYGPPGTGKTATLVEALYQIHQCSQKRILVCTPSNTAADEITKRLLKFVPDDSVYRIYSRSKDASDVDENIRLCSNVEDGQIIHPKYEQVIKKKIVITTLCNSISLIIMKIPHDHFSHVFIDEAGQGTEPDMLIPISLVSNGGRLYSQIVFAGDPQQLGPTVISKLAQCILGRSILERLMSYSPYKKDRNNKYNPKYITKLLENYRSHPDIIHVSNELFYEKELIAKCPRANQNEKFPVIFHGIEGKEEKDPHSRSNCNREEIGAVLAYVNDLLKHGNNRLGFGVFTAKNIGIVTPYAFQSKVIKDTLKKQNLNNIKVGTTELFQGQERQVMIVTTVKSEKFVYQGKEHIGFLSNPKRFNVAITRAKKLLVVIGNPNVLQIENNWRYLLKNCVDNKSYKGLKFSLRGLSDNKGNITPKLVKSSVLLDDLSLSLPLYEEKPILDDLFEDF